jgi:hypothetical protein
MSDVSLSVLVKCDYSLVIVCCLRLVPHTFLPRRTVYIALCDLDTRAGGPLRLSAMVAPNWSRHAASIAGTLVSLLFLLGIVHHDAHTAR